MKTEILNLTFASSLTDLCEANSSFDSGVLRIAYPGTNRNGSNISKATFEKCMKTMYNCPVVCNYDRESDSLGGHDVELVCDSDGNMRLVNMTQPVGVIPENANVYWDTVEEDDGTVREYLCAEVLLWKRQEAYQKIKRDGICAQSMEINVKSGKRIDGIYYIYDFEFTAFALISVTPCFESASLTFAKENFKQMFSEMMHELKENYTSVNSSPTEDDNKKYSTEGGNIALEKNELIAKYNVDVKTLDFSIDDFTVEELEEKFKALNNSANKDNQDNDNFALTSNVVEEICNSLSAEKVQREWGECSRYSFVDCDLEAMEVYCWDRNDWLLYGFGYKLNGDSVVIDFESKKRKKYTIVDFDEGEQPSPFAEIFEQMSQKLNESIAENAANEQKYQDASASITAMETELTELRQFKADTEGAAARNEKMSKIEEVFSGFGDLDGVEAFEQLRSECEEDCMKYEIDALEEKCFAIRGRQGVSAKFSAGKQTPKLKVEKEEKTELPYGGLFEEYGIKLHK